MKLKRLIAGVASAAMMLSIGSSLAFAATANDVTDTATGKTLTFDSVMNLSADAISAPVVTYTYTIENGDEGSYYAATLIVGSDGNTTTGVATSTPIYAGVEYTTKDTEEAEFTTSDYADGNNQVVKTVSFDFADAGYTVAGVYHYTITETVSENSYETLYNQYDNVYDVYVLVKMDANNDCYIASLFMLEDEITSSTNDAIDEDSVFIKSCEFLHSYGIAGSDPDLDNDDEDPEPGTTDDNAGIDYIVTDAAFGDMANHDKAFSFNVTVDGVEDYTILAVTDGKDADGTAVAYVVVVKGDLYAVTAGTGDNAGKYYYGETEVSVATYDPDDAVEFSLTSSDSFTLKAVTSDMTFTTVISDGADDDYTFYERDYNETTWAAGGSNTYEIVSLDADGDAEQGADFATAKGSRVEVDEGDDPLDDDGIVYTGGFPETGVILEFAPFVIMVLAAGAFIGFRVYTTIKKK